MRRILKWAGYELDLRDEVWRKDGEPEFPDSRVEEDHFRVLIEAMQTKAFKHRATNFVRRLGGA